MIDLHECVRAKRDLTDEIRKGCSGVVVFVFTYPEPGYLVEFFDNENDTIDVITAYPSDIEIEYHSGEEG